MAASNNQSHHFITHVFFNHIPSSHTLQTLTLIHIQSHLQPHNPQPVSIKMRDSDDPLPISSHKPPHSTALLTYSKKETLDSGMFGRGRYKFWALAAIILLAFWSMLTGTVTLRFSAGNLTNRFSEDIAGGSAIRNDFDILEIEEREKVVEHMWDVFVNSRRIKLQRFWQEAFVAAYEELTSDVSEVREAAIAEMSFWFIDLDLPPPQSTNLHKLSWRET